MRRHPAFKDLCLRAIGTLRWENCVGNAEVRHKLLYRRVKPLGQALIWDRLRFLRHFL